ncbi:hypothetical protein KUTeg_010957 [Tegillarca granosa]|uniref:C2H2-type domain-containing protein n=1 Tax=Tegillarca granosa TaxID=220873 RepID=A0ABQ9F2J0_TEGGR|nr:hypothetical protein KUTeg_010957 [Tegillarca granosa]
MENADLGKLENCNSFENLKLFKKQTAGYGNFKKMDKDTEEAVASPSEGASGDPNIMNVAEGVIAEDGNYYIVTEGTEGDNEEVLLVVMNGDGETLETVSCVDGSGIEFLDQEQNLISTVEQTSVSNADEGVLYQIGYTGQSTSSQVSVGNVTSDGSKVEGQYVVAGAPQLKSIEHGASVGSQIVGGNLQTVVEGGPKLKTILPPNLVERLANKGTQGSPVSKKETQSMSENLNTKMSKQTTLGYTTISKSIGSQTPIAKVTKNVVTIDSLKSLGNVLKSGSVSKMPQTDSRNNQIVTLQLGKAQDGRVGHSLLEKSIAMDREEMSKTADVLVELATGNSAGLMGKDKTLMGITEKRTDNTAVKNEKADKMAAGTTISRSTNPKPLEKKETESGSVENGNMKDKNTQNNENGHGGESVAKETRHKKKDVGTELAVTPKQSDRNIGENVEKSGRLDFSKTSLQSNESKEQMNNPLIKRVGDQSPTRRSRRFEKNKTELSPTETGKISSKKSEVSSRTKNASTKKSEGTSTVTENFGNNKTAARNSGSSKTTLSPTTRKKNCATMTDLEESENDGDNSTDHCHEKQQARENTSMLNTKQNSGLKCYKCNKNFTNKSNLKRHMKNHEKDNEHRSGEHGRFRPKSVVGTRKRKKKDLDNENSSEDRDRSDVDESDSENLIDLKSDDDNWSENDSVTELMDSVDNMSDSTSLTNLSTHSSKNEFSCTECHESFASKDLMIAHINSTHKNQKRMSNSPKKRSSIGKGKKIKVNKNEEKENTLERKNKVKNVKIKSESGDPKALLGNVAYMMDQDLTVERKKIKTENGIADDESSEKSVGTPCEKCGQHCENIEEHMNSYHTSDIYSCEVCENVFSTLDQYRTHVLSKHYTTDFSESEPNKTSPNMVKNGSEEELVSDSVCQASGPSSVDQHSRLIQTNMEEKSISEKNRPFSCEICDVTFSSKNWIDKHLKLKHNEGDYKLPILVCETCGSEFLERYTLNHHRLTHVKNPKLFECGICLGNFKTRTKLDNHDCSADGIMSVSKKPFPCKKCPLSFKTSDSLHIHYRKHFMMKTNKFCCKVCYKTFTCYVYLKRHVMYSHAQSRDYICDICGKDFKRVDTLT